MPESVDMSAGLSSERAAGTLAWGDLPPKQRPLAMARLIGWVEAVLIPGWPLQTEQITRHPCWPLHVDILTDLRGVSIRWRHCAIPPVDDQGTVELAKVELLMDWVVSLELAAGRWAASLKTCDSKQCARQPGTDADAQTRRERWSQETWRHGAETVGHELPTLAPDPEPWQIAAAVAAKVVGASPPIETGDLASMEAAGPPPVTW